jgi:hypothetical protein
VLDDAALAAAVHASRQTTTATATEGASPEMSAWRLEHLPR